MSNASKELTLGALKQASVVVVKDNHAFYDPTRTRMLQCGYMKVGDETLSLIHQVPIDCPGRVYNAGDVTPEVFPNSILTTKLRAGNEYVWITPETYTTWLAACAACCDPNQLAAVEDFEAVPGDESVAMTWAETENATNYVIERATDINFTTPVEVYSGPDLEFEDTDVINDTTYYYRIKAEATGYTDSEWVLLSATPTV